MTASTGKRGPVQCPYCDSQDVTNCGDIGSGEDHYECNGCRCGFPEAQAMTAAAGKRPEPEPDRARCRLCQRVIFDGDVGWYHQVPYRNESLTFMDRVMHCDGGRDGAKHEPAYGQ